MQTFIEIAFICSLVSAFGAWVVSCLVSDWKRQRKLINPIWGKIFRICGYVSISLFILVFTLALVTNGN